MADNLALWNAVEKTPPDQTKPITGKTYKGTSPKPHYLIRKATETFGPCGIGWGFTVEERVEPGAMIADGFFEKMHVAKVRVWYKWQGERGEVEHIGGTMFSGRYSSGKAFTDEDAPKKSVTDALVKALSMIGFAGDIFIGRYDDSKYVNDLRDEFAEKADNENRGQESAHIAERMMDYVRQIQSMDRLNAWWKSQSEAKAFDQLTEADWLTVKNLIAERKRALSKAEPANMLEAG